MMKLINTWIKDNYKEIKKILVKLKKEIHFLFCYIWLYAVVTITLYNLQSILHNFQLVGAVFEIRLYLLLKRAN